MTARTTQDMEHFHDVERALADQRSFMGAIEPWARLKARVLELVPFSMVCTGIRGDFKLVYHPTDEQSDLLDKIDAMIAHIRGEKPA